MGIARTDLAPIAGRLALFALLLAAAILLLPQPTLAQDATDEPADTPDTAEGDAEGDDAGEAESEAPADGAETPDEAATRYLTAWQAGNLRDLLAVVPPAQREAAETHAPLLLAAMTIDSFRCQAATIGDDGTTARLVFTWDAVPDLEELVEGMLQQRVPALEELGLTEDQINERLSAMRPILRDNLRPFVIHLLRTEHTMTLTQVNNRWYVQEPIAMPNEADDE